jgi:hypothetical protein
MTTATINIKTVFTHETAKHTWYVDHNDDSDVQYPFSVSMDEDYICSRKTLAEAMDMINTFCGDISNN